MSVQVKPRTSDVNDRLWGARAGDWADIQEGMLRAAFEATARRCDATSRLWAN